MFKMILELYLDLLGIQPRGYRFWHGLISIPGEKKDAASYCLFWQAPITPPHRHVVIPRGEGQGCSGVSGGSESSVRDGTSLPAWDGASTTEITLIINKISQLKSEQRAPLVTVPNLGYGI